MAPTLKFRIWYLVTFFTLVSSCSVFAQRFQEQFGLATAGSHVVFADFNNDGLQDVFISNSEYFAGKSTVYKNNGAGNFIAVLDFPVGDPGTVSIEDYDRDGLVDIYLTGASASFFSSTSYLYRNKGNFVFEEIKTSGLPIVDYGSANFGDADNDGDNDVLLDRGTAYEMNLYQNDGGLFSVARTITAPYRVSPVSKPWNDYDRDGDNDFITASAESGTLMIFRNDGFGKIKVVDFGVAGVAVRGFKWANINNDALPDLVLFGSREYTDVFEVYIQQPDHSFNKLNQTFEGFSSGDVLPIDLDNDGDTDLIVAGKQSYQQLKSVNLIYTNVNGVFTASPSTFPVLDGAFLAAADYDQDNDLDIIISGVPPNDPFNKGKSVVFKNTGTEKNTKPLAPASTLAEVEGQKVKISWPAGSDQQTPTAALTYKVFAGKSSTNYNLIGDAGTNLFKIFENLGPGTYYYRVQTIDGANEPSALSPEGQFLIRAEAPAITQFTPAIAYEGDTLFITGKNFLNASAVTINNKPADFTVINSSSIRLIIPSVKHSGKIKITTPLGVATSATDFCEKPRKLEIIGDLQPCFGDVTYKLSNLIPGITYHWAVDNGGQIVSQNADQVVVRYPARGTYQLSLYPESCTKGDVTVATIYVRGAKPDVILGNREPFTEDSQLYTANLDVSNQTYTWTKDGVVVKTSSYSGLPVTWTDPGTHQLKLTVLEDGCPNSKVELSADINVKLNQYSFKYDMPSLDELRIGAPTLTADLDGDGDEDFLEDNNLYENVNGNLVKRSPYTSFTYPEIITPIDVDNDNDIDLLVKQNYIVKLLRNNGSLSFTEVWTSDEIYYKGASAAAIDYNLDGKVDLGEASNVYPNAANSFGSAIEIFALNAGKTASVFDYNRDGYPDMMMKDGFMQLNGGEISSRFYRDFKFKETPAYYSDFNRDGLYDFLYSRPDGFVIDFSKGGEANVMEAVRPYWEFTFQDVNLDGFIDILYTDYYKLNIWTYDPALNTFKKAFTRDTPNNKIKFLDLDKDGVREMLVVQTEFSNKFHFSVYKNNTPKPVMNVPADLKSSTGNLNVELAWKREPGNFYNVVVGTSVGATNILSPLANLTTGKGFLQDNGNAGLNNFYKLNLPAGTYYWSVQAVTESGVRSMFAAWKSFTVEAQTSMPTDLKLQIEPQGISVSWKDNSTNETNFIIERRSGTNGEFVELQTVPPNTTRYVDLSATTDEEFQYRVSALVATGKKLNSKVASTLFAIVHRFPYDEGFEKDIPIPTYITRDAPMVNIGGPYNTEPGWMRTVNRYPFYGDGYVLESKSATQALITPAFNISEMEYPVFRFDITWPAQLPNQFENFEIRVESSIDGGETWSMAYGMASFDRNWLWSFLHPRYQTLELQNSENVKFRIRNRGDLALDHVGVVDAPAPVTDWTVSQTAQKEVKITWTNPARATHYLIQRYNASKSESKIFDLVDASLSQGFYDRTVEPSATYSYSITSYIKSIDQFCIVFNESKSITTADIPLSIQSIYPVVMQANETKEIPVTILSSVTPINDLTLNVTSSNPQINNVSLVRNGNNVKIVVRGDSYTGDTNITVQASNGTLSDSKTFKLSVFPATLKPSGEPTQRFCYGAIVKDLSASGNDIKWYATPISSLPLDLSTALVDGSHYYATQTNNGLESNSRLDVVALIGTQSPTGSAEQFFCVDPTIADIIVTGSSIKWYNSNAGGSSFSSSALLSDGVTYYASQTINGCESQTRLAVKVSIGVPTPAGLTTQSRCPGATVESLEATGDNIKWYLTPTGGSALASTATLEHNIHYYASQTVNGCNSKVRLDVVVNIAATPIPSGSPVQLICSQGTIADLNTSGVNVKWYDQPVGGTLLETSSQLRDGVHYYASQTRNNCESVTRLDVVASLKEVASPTGKNEQQFCVSATVSDLIVDGSSVKWYSTASGGTELTSTTSLINNSHYFATQTVDGCESVNRFNVLVTINPKSPVPSGDKNQKIMEGSTIAALTVTGLNIKWYTDSGINQVSASTSLVEGKYYATQSPLGCESDPLEVNVSFIEEPVTGLEPEIEPLKVYPNPVHDDLAISYSSTIQQIILLNSIGQEVLVIQIDNTTAVIDLSSVGAGIYTLKIITSDEIISRKVIKL